MHGHIIPYVYNKEVISRFDRVFGLCSSGLQNIIRLGMMIELPLTADDLRGCYEKGVSWYLIGNNDLTAAVLGKDRFDDWGDEEIYKTEKLHPKVKEVIKTMHETLVEVAEGAESPLVVGCAGAQMRSPESIEFFKTLATGRNIVYYHVARTTRKECSDDLYALTLGGFYSGEVPPEELKHI